MAYSAQRYTGANPASLAAVAEGTRTAGAVFAFDTWTLSRRATLVYGGRVARYGYIDKALFSPRCPARDRGHRTPALQRRRGRTRRGARRRGVRAVERRRNLAAARAHVRSADGHAVPARAHATPTSSRWRRISAPKPCSACARSTSAPTTRSSRCSVSGSRARPGTSITTPLSSAGDFVARGWTVSLSRVVARRCAAASTTPSPRRNGDRRPTREPLAEFAPSALRAGRERLHDLTTSVQAEIPVHGDARVRALPRSTPRLSLRHVAQTQPEFRRTFRRAGDPGAARSWTSPTRSGRCCSASATCSASSRRTPRSTTSCSSSGRRSAWSVG